MRLSIASLLLFLASAIFTGCGGNAQPGSTVTDDTPGGKPSPPIENPEDPQMGDDYIEANK